MERDERLANAKRGVGAFLEQVAPQDRVGLTTFSDQIVPLLALGDARRLPAAVDGLIADGGTALFDATAAAFAAMRGAAADGERINASAAPSHGRGRSGEGAGQRARRELDTG